MKYQYTIHHEEIAYDGFFKFNRFDVSFETFTDGAIEHVIRECGRKGDIVAVLPYDPVTQEFLMVEQFRIGPAARGEHPWTLEIVAGFMDIEGESPLQTARRELTEETGCTAKSMHKLISYSPGPGGSAALITIFIAEVDVNEMVKYSGVSEEGEDICVHRLPLEKMREKTYAGQHGNATTSIAYQQFFMNNWVDQFKI
ncbi:MAG: ADP-ribose pyrophosphatase [Gammaproteobacteria bacterium]|nr:MAG: ADP-ribose pyrophosphatase [Gammaproteobacteria bacterium]